MSNLQIRDANELPAVLDMAVRPWPSLRTMRVGFGCATRRRRRDGGCGAGQA